MSALKDAPERPEWACTRCETGSMFSRAFRMDWCVSKRPARHNDSNNIRGEWDGVE
jgi:hypothetical protein